MQIDWQYLQDNWDWAGHIVEAAGIVFVVGILFRLVLDWKSAALVGLSFANGHFHGREKRDYEISVQMPPPHLDGYRMWDWTFDQITDFWPVSIVCAVAIFIIVRRTDLARSSGKS